MVDELRGLIVRVLHMCWASMILLGVWAAYWMCVCARVMLHAALPGSLHLSVTLPVFLISSLFSFTLHPYTLLVMLGLSSWPHPLGLNVSFVAVTWPLHSWCIQLFLSAGLFAELGLHLLASPPRAEQCVTIWACLVRVYTLWSRTSAQVLMPSII
jgi:hypothetical protein